MASIGDTENNRNLKFLIGSLLPDFLEQPGPIMVFELRDKIWADNAIKMRTSGQRKQCRWELERIAIQIHAENEIEEQIRANVWTVFQVRNTNDIN